MTMPAAAVVGVDATVVATALAVVVVTAGFGVVGGAVACGAAAVVPVGFAVVVVPPSAPGPPLLSKSLSLSLPTLLSSPQAANTKNVDKTTSAATRRWRFTSSSLNG